MFPKPQKGTATRTRRTRRTRSERAFRDAVWLRDGVQVPGYTCGRCARCHVVVVRGVNGEVDHIKPRSTHPELAFDVTNARLTCSTCNQYLKTHPLERER